MGVQICRKLLENEIAVSRFFYCLVQCNVNKTERRCAYKE